MKLFDIDSKATQKPASDKIVNVASVPQRSPFRYPGGKTWFVPTFRKWLKSKKQTPSLLIEPFAGGGIIGLTAAFENLAKKVLLVELDENVAAVWKVLIEGNHEKLARRIVDFEMNITNVRKTFEKIPGSTDERAFQTILKNRVSHGGIMAPGSGLIKNGENGRGISSRWYPETLAKRIIEIGTVRSKLAFTQGDAFTVVEDFLDDKGTVYFVDPPYTASGKRAGRRLYSHHNLDHRDLFRTFNRAKGDFIFTYDDSEDLKKLAKEHDLQTQLIPMKNTHHAEMTELVVGRSLEWLK